MWCLFLFLICIICFAYKYIDESSTNEVIKKRELNAIVINEKIRIRKEDEDKIYDEFMHDESRYRVLNIISTDLTKIFGADWEIKINSRFSGLFYTPADIAFHVYCSSIGCIPSSHIFRYEIIGSKEIREYKIKALEIIEHNIQKFYPDLSMIFIPAKNYDISEQKMIYSDDVCGGSVLWMHDINHFDKNMKMHMKKLW